MIDEIQVENLALIREAALVPARGLTVLTGETGAGKTALLSALKLLMGARADKDAVRDGEEALVVSGRFLARRVTACSRPTALPRGGARRCGHAGLRPFSPRGPHSFSGRILVPVFHVKHRPAPFLGHATNEERRINVSRCWRPGRIARGAFVLEYRHAYFEAEHTAGYHHPADRVRRRVAGARVLPAAAMDAHHRGEGCVGMTTGNRAVPRAGLRRG